MTNVCPLQSHDQKVFDLVATVPLKELFNGKRILEHPQIYVVTPEEKTQFAVIPSPPPLKLQQKHREEEQEAKQGLPAEGSIAPEGTEGQNPETVNDVHNGEEDDGEEECGAEGEEGQMTQQETCCGGIEEEEEEEKEEGEDAEDIERANQQP